MRLLVNGSGSDGNNYILTANNGEQLLLDLGISAKDIKKSLDFNISNIVGAIVTHSHL